MKKLAKMLLCLLMMGTINSPINLSAENENKDDKYYKDGKLATSTWVEVKDKWYFTNSEGEAIKNKWIASGKNWFHLKEDGTMSANEWYATSGNRWYYLDEEGKMADFPLFIDGKLQGFNEDGTWQKYEVKVKGVPVSISGSYVEEYVEYYLQQLELLPTSLVSIPEQYIFTDDLKIGIISTGGVTYSDSRYNSVSGKYEAFSKISINSNVKGKDTILHELTHALDTSMYYDKQQFVSESETFKNARDKEKEPISSYLNTQNDRELFAYLTTDYFSNPEVAMSQYPLCASYIKQVFESKGIDIPHSYFEVTAQDEEGTQAE